MKDTALVHGLIADQEMTLNKLSYFLNEMGCARGAGNETKAQNMHRAVLHQLGKYVKMHEFSREVLAKLAGDYFQELTLQNRRSTDD